MKEKNIRNNAGLLLEENKEHMIAIIDRIPIDDIWKRNWIKNSIRQNNKKIEELVFSKQAIDERTSGFAKTMKEKESKILYGKNSNKKKTI